MRLLLVDDNPDDRLLAMRMLHREIPGLELEEIRDAEELRRALDRGGFEVAVTDYRLRWTDGIAVLGAVRARYPGLPVVMFTSSGSEEVAVEAMKAGLDDYVLKSVGHAARLPAAVGAAVERARGRKRVADLESLVNRLAALVESSDDAIIGKTLDGVISSWNAGAERIFGYTAEEAVGRHISLLAPAGQRDEIPGILERIRRGERIAPYETRRRRKDGVIIDVSLSVSPIRDDAGQVIGASKIARDVTERKRTEQQLARVNRELQERVGELQTLLEILPLGVWIGDATSARIVGNRAAYEMLGLPPGTNVSPTAPEVLAGTHPGFKYCLDGKEVPVDELPMRAAVLRGEPIKNFEQAIVFDDGRVVTIQGSAAPLFDGRGQVRGAVAACADITERKRAEEALKAADRNKDEFLAMLGHELRNPLGPIRNAVQVLNVISSQDPDARSARGMIERQVGHMARLIDDLLDVSRIARGKIQLRAERCDLARIVRDTAADYAPALEAAGLALELDVPGDPLWVTGDATRLCQVVGNLLHNAQKFTDAGGRVLVRAAAEPGGDGAVIAVRDTGIGIEPEVLARMFDAFSQADTSLDRTRGGLGLGLALVKGLVELHGGEVRAASAGAGRGAEFTVRLPLERRAGPAGRAGDPKPPEGRPARVLIVEDNIDAAESLRMLLKLSGHEVAVTHDGPAALETAGSFRPELVLCDLGLPGGMSGYDVARVLRQKTETAATPLIALSGYGREEDRRRAREAGFDIHLTKPVDFARLREILATPPRRPRGD
jgi:PAS domain S-box-containing protein